MALASPIRSRERILVMGGPGTGKSNNALAIAKKINGKMYVIDNDNAYDRLLDYEPKLHVEEGGNVDVRAAYDWDATIGNVSEITREMTRDDWIVVDILTPTWQMVQTWFSENVYGDDLATYMLTARQGIQSYNEKAKNNKDMKEVKNLQPFDGFMDWSVINPQYQKMMKMLRTAPGHVYCTAEVDAVDSKNDNAEVQGMYGAYNVKPRGQKRMGHEFSTILLLTKGKAGDWKMTTVKDRAREEVERVDVKDFAMTYLFKIAGWRSAE